MEIKVYNLDKNYGIYKKGVFIIIIETPVKIKVLGTLGIDYGSWKGASASSILLGLQTEYNKETGSRIDDLLYTGGDSITNSKVLRLIFEEVYK